MQGRSRYDELHDQYTAIQTTKRGTRYERLAAVVFAALDKTSVVIHDLKVVGADTGVSHQIDVHIESNGRARHILIECKDFDVSGNPVGLGIVRDFWGVVDDVHPHESWIITCNDFTSDARRYAKGKGIKLATLRAFADADWEDRVQTIIVTMDFVYVATDRPDVRIRLSDEDDVRFAEDFARAWPTGGVSPVDDKTQLYDGDTVRSFSEIATRLATTKVLGTTEEQLVESAIVDGWVSADGNNRYAFHGYSVAIPTKRSSQMVTLSAVLDGPKLLLTDDAGLDFVLWDASLRGYTIQPDGSVTLSPGEVQKHLVSTVLQSGAP